MPSCCSNATSASASRLSLGPKTEDVIAGDGERRRRATLADHKDVVRVRERFDHSYFRTGLRPNDDFHTARIKVLNSLQCLLRIMLRVANKESESDRAILGTDVFEISCCNLQCGDGVPAKREPRSVNVASTPILTSDFGVLPASTFAMGTSSATSKTQTMTRMTAKIFIAILIISGTGRHCQEIGIICRVFL
jgi:hypothetical protein